MEIDKLSMIDPAFYNMEQVCIAQISGYMDGLPVVEKYDMGIMSKTPQIPETQEEIQQYIDGYIQLYEATTSREQEELKSELADLCTSLGIKMSHELPLEQFQSMMRHELEGRSAAQLLEAGVFGREFTDEEIAENTARVIKGYLLSIQQAGMDQALVQLGRVDLIASKFDYRTVADKFPLLVSQVKEHVLNRNLLN